MSEVKQNERGGRAASDNSELLLSLIDTALPEKFETKQNKDCCDYCNDGDGNCAYPVYGVQPHVCFYKKEGGFNNLLGTSDMLPKETWPDNYKPDPEGGNCGTYTHCLECGRGKS